MRKRIPKTLLHEIFDRVAAASPDAIAVDVPPGLHRPDRRVVTYEELAAASDAIASALRPVATADAVVAILAGRNSELLYAAQLGALRAGVAYTCLDPAFPDDQMRDVLEEAGAVALLADRAGAARLSHAGITTAPVIDLGAIADVAAGEPARRAPSPRLDACSLAYVIYTSGTTGRPKGVMIEHASIVNLVESDMREFALGAGDRVAQGSSPAYDSSIEETWLAFAAGATLVVMDDDTARLGPDLIDWLQRERITVFCPPPTLLRATGCANPMTALPDLRLLYVGGEALSQDVADRWAPGRRLVNGYGPTEVTVTCVRADVRAGEPIAIGVPVPGLSAYVLNESLELLGDEEQGELCLAGIALARGYRNLPEVTAARFPVHPVLGRIYRTGDLVHRAADGRLFYHGRLDSQVKLRGYRVELEAIETKLAAAEGVREAACRVQGDPSNQTLVAFIVPSRPQAPPDLDDLQRWLRHALPAYMVPARMTLLASLPKTVGGKVNRPALPMLEWRPSADARPLLVPSSDTEACIAAAFRRTLAFPSPISTDADFFEDLGGDSLRAAMTISVLREDPSTASLTVRDLYDARTVIDLARRVRPVEDAATTEERLGTDQRVSDAGVFFATVAQAAWLMATLVPAAIAGWFLLGLGLPWAIERFGLLGVVVGAPTFLAALVVIYTPLALGVAVLAKRVLIGRYVPTRAPVWSAFYVRHWIVQESAHLVPWRLLEGTILQHWALRALGARIGQRVHIHRGVDLRQGGWDLLDIGDDVTISQDAELRLVDLDAGQIIIGAITIERGATLDVRAGVGPGAHLEADSYLTSLSAVPAGGRIPAGERWDGVPAQHAGDAPDAPAITHDSPPWRPITHALLLLVSRLAAAFALALPFELAFLAVAWRLGGNHARVAQFLLSETWDWPVIVGLMLMTAALLPVTVAMAALISRALGRVTPGVINRWSASYVRVWLKVDLLEFANTWLGGTLFWPTWLRAAGMQLGRGCEISTIIDVVPELVRIGPDTFLADGIYLNGPRVHRGTVTLNLEQLGRDVFLGNHVVIAGGEPVPDDVLLGVCTTAGERRMTTHTAWFGHPPFPLPRREVIEADRNVTHTPSLIRVVNRVFWESARFVLPMPTLLATLAWFKALAFAESAYRPAVFLWVAVPLITLAVPVGLCVMVITLKWILLGRVKPRQHPLWCCWCSRWDFLYEVWGFHAREALSPLEGTLLLSWFLRAMGVRIGKRVVLGHSFSQVVDPDMLEFDDESTVDGQFQAHTFEDRVLKIDRVRVRKGATVGSAAVLLYGADIGEHTRVDPHSVVMKRERLLPGRRYSGCPTRMVS